MIPNKYHHPRNAVFKAGKNYLKRIGKCNPRRCGAACCRFFHCRQYQYARYFAGFMDAKIKADGKGGAFINRPCKFLKNNRCTRWKKRPVPCYQFPIPSDEVYKQVKGKCSYRFVRITRKEYERGIEKHGKPQPK
jgi:hypothetical protein